VPQPAPTSGAGSGPPGQFPAALPIPLSASADEHSAFLFVRPVRTHPITAYEDVAAFSKWRATNSAVTGSTRLSRIISSKSGKPLAASVATAAGTS
jgi:hypothetical protein